MIQIHHEHRSHIAPRFHWADAIRYALILSERYGKIKRQGKRVGEDIDPIVALIRLARRCK